jgi:hypothetical protein
VTKSAVDQWDAIVLGGGAAGLFCAGVAGQLGLKVLVLDHAQILGEKIRISGGGRCNFTNLHSSPHYFLSLNPNFAKSALARYSANDFINLVKRYQIAFHEKHQGQLFCDESAKDIIHLLVNECKQGKVRICHPVDIQSVSRTKDTWAVETSMGRQFGTALVLATGGLPVPAIGASAFSLEIAKQFDLAVTEIRPGLVPLSFTDDAFSSMSELSGLSLPVQISAGKKNSAYGSHLFNEDLLITHKGLSGPAVLQASNYWHEGESIQINWAYERDCHSEFLNEDNRLKVVEHHLAEMMPKKLADFFAAQLNFSGRKWTELAKKDRIALANLLNQWSVKPAGTLGWKKAEVMLGGVDTRELDSQSMMSKKHPNLYFIGECVDVTGHLGGHNFQWAWSSAYACARAMAS